MFPPVQFALHSLAPHVAVVFLQAVEDPQAITHGPSGEQSRCAPSHAKFCVHESLHLYASGQ